MLQKDYLAKHKDFIAKVSNTYAQRQADEDDFKQEGYIALLGVIDKVDYSRSKGEQDAFVRLSIRNALRNYARKMYNTKTAKTMWNTMPEEFYDLTR